MAKKQRSDMTKEEKELLKKEKEKEQERQKNLPIEEKGAAYITTKNMLEYIETKHPEDIEWFSKVAKEEFKTKRKNKDTGKTEEVIANTEHVFNRFHAKAKFIEKYFPEKVKKKEEKVKDQDLFDEWVAKHLGKKKK